MLFSFTGGAESGWRSASRPAGSVTALPASQSAPPNVVVSPFLVQPHHRAHRRRGSERGRILAHPPAPDPSSFRPYA